MTSPVVPVVEPKKTSPEVPVVQPNGSPPEAMSVTVHRGGAMADMTDMKVLRKKLQQQRDYDSTEHNEVLNRMHMCCGHFHPESKPRIVWDILLLCLILYCAVVVPLDLGLGGLENDHLENVNHFILVFFSIDIILNFNTAYFDGDGNLITRRCKMVQKYCKGWFLLDFMSTFPFDLVLAAMGGSIGNNNFDGQLLMRLPRIIKCTRLARITRIAKVQEIIERSVGLYLLTSLWFTLFLRLATLFTALLLISHWSACGFCKLAEIDEDPSITEDVFDGVEHVGWTYQGVNAMDMSPGQRYRVAFYLSFCMLTMAKPKDIGFLTSYCRYYFMIFGFVKPMVGAAIMGVLTNMIVKQNTRKGQLQQKRTTLGKFMQQKQVDTNTVHQVLAYVDHADAQLRSAEEVEAVKGLSPTLRDELAYQTMHARISKFTLISNEFGESMVRSLCPVLKLEYYGPDDLVFQEGHLMGGMVFLNSGTFKQFRHVARQKRVGQDQEAYDDSEGPLSHYEELPEVTGDALGATAILCEHHQRSHTTVLCYTFCELTFLTRIDFRKVVSQNPKWGVILDRIAKILAPFDDDSEVMHALKCGNSKPLEALLPHTSKEEAHQCWNKLRIHTKSASEVNSVLRSLRSAQTQEFVEETTMTSQGARSDLRRRNTGEVQGDAPSTGWAEGFQSMQLNSKERHMMQELQHISERQRKMENRIECRMDKLESMTSEMYQMLKGSLVAANCSTPEASIPAQNVTNAFLISSTEAPNNEHTNGLKSSSVIARWPVTGTTSASKPTEKATKPIEKEVNDDAISVAKAATQASTIIPLTSNGHFSNGISQAMEGQKRQEQIQEIEWPADNEEKYVEVPLLT